MKVKRDIGVLIQLLKNFVSRHVVFLEHISFFSFPSSIHDLTRSDLLHIDPFFEDCSNLSSQVSSTSDALLMFFLLLLYIIFNVLLLIVL